MILKFETPIQFLKGVGPKLGAVLRKKGVLTIGDLLDYYPRAYEDRRAGLNIRSLQPHQVVSLAVEVMGVHSQTLGRTGRRVWDLVVRDNSGVLHCKFFRIPYRNYFEQFETGKKIRVVGKVLNYRGRIEFHHPEIRSFGSDENGVETKEETLKDELVPIYAESEGISSAKIRKLIEAVFEGIKAWPREEKEKFEILPDKLRTSLGLSKKFEALEKIHFPESEMIQALLDFSTSFQKRLIFEEFFWLELLLASRRMRIKREDAPPMEMKLELAKKLRDSLPFQLTGAQTRTFKEVVKDLCTPHPMHRLVQGDVGSGKTIVAFLAAVFAFESGFQTAMMVPTEILAEQHFKTAKKWLTELGLRVELLTGSMKESERVPILKGLKDGSVNLLLGTHALIQDPVEFKRLGLVVVDEQHRFGVEQRNKLKQKGESPHFLLMTATPIPRTLALTVYGDLDVSIMNERPKGRQAIETRVVTEAQRNKTLEFLREQLKKGQQAYVIYPLVEESEKLDLKNAQTEFERLKDVFSEFNVGLLHGRMKASEKDQAMRDFYENKTQILVATTVVEVGVDVPNANVIMIEHSERFGLSQLHQLRGRVGRGAHKSYCLLAMGPSSSPEARERCRIMESTDDGFKISEADLQIRGPGEFLGVRQSGLPEFKMADLLRDAELLEHARGAAFDILSADPFLKSAQHQGIREELTRVYGQRIKELIG